MYDYTVTIALVSEDQKSRGNKIKNDIKTMGGGV